jgi:Asp-tRNA(Asn)/Glu-tRNA(Gln) amidotransferase A subunit family amidase
MHDRRAFVAACCTAGIGSTLLPGVLWGALTRGADITVETIACAEEIAGISLTAEQREMMLENLRRQQRAQAALHAIPIGNSLQPAFYFDPLPPGRSLPPRITNPPHPPAPRLPLGAMPQSVEELAFSTVAELAPLVRERRVSSTELTEMYLRRLERHDAQLHAVITLMGERARAQARALDEELAIGRYRGPLHGIPWGAKDLLAVRDHRTTWGAAPLRNQVIDEDATVVKRLDEAGAVLVAKLTLGELAQGDVWFGETTRNPWYPEQGSSGSSAGAGAGVAAGLVGFAIGSETLGSISSPSTRNGVTGLRPTFGRVPRTGAMALSWSMDKIGPMCRSAEDCALVLEAINGPDGIDRSTKNVPFTRLETIEPGELRVGYFRAAFEAPERDASDSSRVLRPARRFDDEALAVLRGLGIDLVAVDPPEFNSQALSLILTAEAGAAFEEMTLSKRVDELVQQGPNAWPNTFRAAQFIPAVDYINANRVRTRLMEQWWELFQSVDVVVSPTFGTNQLLGSNLTGNPAVIMPHGFIDAPLLRRPETPADSLAARGPRPQVPTSITFLGGLYDEARLIALAAAYQGASDWHRRRPPGFQSAGNP